MTYLAALWITVALIVIGLAIWRKMVASSEGLVLHVGLDGVEAEKQSAITRKLAQIDQWGKTLTVVDVVICLVLLGLYAHNVWVQTSQL